MPRITDDALRQVQDALEMYEAEVRASAIAEASKKIYTLYPRMFVRWLDYDYEPGITLRRMRDREMKS